MRTGASSTSGVDPLALLRAAGQFVLHGHNVSGASTLTMQVARLLEPRPRTLLGKLRQVARAIEMERTLTKDEVLALYLGSRRSAAISKACARPRSPISARSRAGSRSARRRSWSLCRNRRKRAGPTVLPRLRARRAIVSSTAWPSSARKRHRARQGRAGADARLAMPFLAPHRRRGRSRGRITDHDHHRRGLQKGLEDLARASARLGPEISCDPGGRAATGEILASAPISSTRPRGQVDIARALRSPGSTLKPFIYGLAFEDGSSIPRP